MTIYYIVGNGFSGSTLLDITLGSTHGIFSMGELTYIARPHLSKEYCSCGKKLGECELWSKIRNEWESSMAISMEDYNKLRNIYELNKNILKLVKGLISQKDINLNTYIEETKRLYNIIERRTEADILVDSSKNPSRLLILRKFASVKVFHILRDFRGFYNSSKAFYKKNRAEGIEVEIPKKSFTSSLFTWIINNLLSYLVSLNMTYHKVTYKEFVNIPYMLNNFEREIWIRPNDLSAEHMMAGNRMRLKKNFEIDSSLGMRYERLGLFENCLSRIVNRVFFFWS